MKVKRALIKKLQKVVALGHIPKRQMENYFFTTEKNEDVCSCVNCLAHACFNLSNEDIEKLGITENHGRFFGDFNSDIMTPDSGLERQVVDFVEKTGLEMKPTSRQFGGLNKNQWRVAMYIDHSGISLCGKDFHFFLQERDGSWSHKRGYFSNVEKKEFIGQRYEKYDYYKTYVITNPNAKEF